MSGETKLQLTQNRITNCLIIPCFETAHPNPVNGELYFDTTYSYLCTYYNGWIHVL